MKALYLSAALVFSLGAAYAAEGTGSTVSSRIDPNTFIVLPPASVNWTLRSANQDHPAVRVARAHAHAPQAIDANTFIVQPPAAVTWTLRSEPESGALALAR